MYLKTLSTGKAKIAIAEFANCGIMYQDTLQTLERKFGQPHAVVSVHLKILSQFLGLKIHISEYIINHSATNSGLARVFRSFLYVKDLTVTALLGQGVQKLPPNLQAA